MGKKEKLNESPHISTTSLFLCAVVAAAKTNKQKKLKDLCNNRAEGTATLHQYPETRQLLPV